MIPCSACVILSQVELRQECAHSHPILARVLILATHTPQIPQTRIALSRTTSLHGHCPSMQRCLPQKRPACTHARMHGKCELERNGALWLSVSIKDRLSAMLLIRFRGGSVHSINACFERNEAPSKSLHGNKDGGGRAGGEQTSLVLP